MGATDGAQGIQRDIIAEGCRLAEAAAQANLPLRLLGGVAIHLRIGGAMPALFQRQAKDLDCVVLKGHNRSLKEFFIRAGYEPNTSFNALHGDRRLVFYDQSFGRQVDVFVQTFEMCHTLPLAERLLLEPLTLPLAELLMTKLQIVRLNQKDVNDMFALLLTYDTGTVDGETVNIARIAKLCGRNWGLYRTFQQNLAILEAATAELDLSADERALLVRRLTTLRTALEAEPKTLAWKVRSTLGERVRWYQDPEEIEHA